MNSPRPLHLPLEATDIAELTSGEAVTISGTLFTARDAAHARFAESLAAGQELPIPLEGQVLYFVGPTPARPRHPIGSAGPTTASRMDAYSPLLIERGLRGMIGKGHRSEAVKRSMRENGCVYFGAIEGTAALLAQHVRRAAIVAYADLGPEAVHHLEVDQFPAFVVNDLAGNDLYEAGPATWRRSNRP